MLLGLHNPWLYMNSRSSLAVLHRRASLSLCKKQAFPPVRALASTASSSPPLSPTELAATQELRKRLAARSSGGQGGQVDEATQAWFLRDRRYDVDEAEDKLLKMLAWRRQVLRPPVRAEDVAAEAATGKGFVHSSQDKQGRPVVVIMARYHRLGEFSSEHSQRFCGYLLDKAIGQLPAGTEQLLGVFDMRGFGPLSTDLAFARFLPVWAVVKPLLRKYGRLVRFVSREELRREFFTPETLPEAFRQ